MQKHPGFTCSIVRFFLLGSLLLMLAKPVAARSDNSIFTTSVDAAIRTDSTPIPSMASLQSSKIDADEPSGVADDSNEPTEGTDATPSLTPESTPPLTPAPATSPLPTTEPKATPIPTDSPALTPTPMPVSSPTIDTPPVASPSPYASESASIPITSTNNLHSGEGGSQGPGIGGSSENAPNPPIQTPASATQSVPHTASPVKVENVVLKRVDPIEKSAEVTSDTTVTSASVRTPDAHVGAIAKVEQVFRKTIAVPPDLQSAIMRSTYSYDKAVPVAMNAGISVLIVNFVLAASYLVRPWDLLKQLWQL